MKRIAPQLVDIVEVQPERLQRLDHRHQVLAAVDGKVEDGVFRQRTVAACQCEENIERHIIGSQCGGQHDQVGVMPVLIGEGEGVLPAIFGQGLEQLRPEPVQMVGIVLIRYVATRRADPLFQVFQPNVLACLQRFPMPLLRRQVRAVEHLGRLVGGRQLLVTALFQESRAFHLARPLGVHRGDRSGRIRHRRSAQGGCRGRVQRRHRNVRQPMLEGGQRAGQVGIVAGCDQLLDDIGEGLLVRLFRHRGDVVEHGTIASPQAWRCWVYAVRRQMAQDVRAAMYRGHLGEIDAVPPRLGEVYVGAIYKRDEVRQHDALLDGNSQFVQSDGKRTAGCQRGVEGLAMLAYQVASQCGVVPPRLPKGRRILGDQSFDSRVVELLRQLSLLRVRQFALALRTWRAVGPEKADWQAVLLCRFAVGLQAREVRDEFLFQGASLFREEALDVQPSLFGHQAAAACRLSQGRNAVRQGGLVDRALPSEGQPGRALTRVLAIRRRRGQRRFRALGRSSCAGFRWRGLAGKHDARQQQRQGCQGHQGRDDEDSLLHYVIRRSAGTTSSR